MVKGIESRRKRYVAVTARHDEEGNIVPVCIEWEDGRKFEIDRILDRRRASSLKVGGTGVRFLVRILGRETLLYYENPRWFVEEKIYERAS